MTAQLDFTDKRQKKVEKGTMEVIELNDTPDHMAFKKFIDKGSYDTPEYYQELHCSFMPTKDDFPKKFNVSVRSDRGFITFKSANVAVLRSLITQLTYIYSLFFSDLKRHDPERYKLYIDMLFAEMRKNIIDANRSKSH